MRGLLLVLSIGFGLIFSGCVRSSVSMARFAKGDVTLCKHCNCYMPAHLGEGDSCPACNCGYPAARCEGGR